MPYHNVDYSGAGFPHHYIQEQGEPFQLKKESIKTFRGTDEESVKGFCINMNRKERIETLESIKKLSQLEKEFHPKIVTK